MNNRIIIAALCIVLVGCATTRDNSADRLEALAEAQPTWYAAVTGAVPCKSVMTPTGCADAEAVAATLYLEGKPFAGMERELVESMWGTGNVVAEASGTRTVRYSRWPDRPVFVVYGSHTDTVRHWSTGR